MEIGLCIRTQRILWTLKMCFDEDLLSHIKTSTLLQISFDCHFLKFTWHVDGQVLSTTNWRNRAVFSIIYEQHNVMFGCLFYTRAGRVVLTLNYVLAYVTYENYGSLTCTYYAVKTVFTWTRHWYGAHWLVSHWLVNITLLNANPPTFIWHVELAAVLLRLTNYGRHHGRSQWLQLMTFNSKVTTLYNTQGCIYFAEYFLSSVRRRWYLLC